MTSRAPVYRNHSGRIWMKLLVSRRGSHSGWRNNKFDEERRTPSSVHDFQSGLGLLINRIDTYTICIRDAAIRSSKSLVELRLSGLHRALNHREVRGRSPRCINHSHNRNTRARIRKNLLEDNRGPHIFADASAKYILICHSRWYARLCEHALLTIGRVTPAIRKGGSDGRESPNRNFYVPRRVLGIGIVGDVRLLRKI